LCPRRRRRRVVTGRGRQKRWRRRRLDGRGGDSGECHPAYSNGGGDRCRDLPPFAKDVLPRRHPTDRSRRGSQTPPAGRVPTLGWAVTAGPLPPPALAPAGRKLRAWDATPPAATPQQRWQPPNPPPLPATSRFHHPIPWPQPPRPRPRPQPRPSRPISPPPRSRGTPVSCRPCLRPQPRQRLRRRPTHRRESRPQLRRQRRRPRRATGRRLRLALRRSSPINVALCRGRRRRRRRGPVKEPCPPRFLYRRSHRLNKQIHRSLDSRCLPPRPSRPAGPPLPTPHRTATRAAAPSGSDTPQMPPAPIWCRRRRRCVDRRFADAVRGGAARTSN